MVYFINGYVIEYMKHSLFTIICVTLVVRSAGNIFQPAISYMAEDFGISQVEATANLTLYYFCMTLSFILFGPLCDRYNKNRLLQVSLIGCFLGSVLCGSATHVMMLNIGRSLQAFSAGLALLSSQIWIGEQSDKKSMMGRLAWFSIIVALSPIFAPMVGGFLSDCFSWRYDFWLITLLCLAGLIVVFFIPLSELEKSDKEELALGRTSRNAFKSILYGYDRVLRKSPVLSFSLCVQVLYIGQSMFATISSFLFIDKFNITASKLGVLSGVLVLGMLLGRFPTLYLRKHLSNRAVFLFNEALVILSSVISISYYYVTNTHSIEDVMVTVFLQAIGFSGLAILSMSNVMLVSGDDKGVASGFYNFMNQGVAWLGVLCAQLCYHAGMDSILIFQYMACFVLVGCVASIVLFLRVYPKYQNQLE